MTQEDIQLISNNAAMVVAEMLLNNYSSRDSTQILERDDLYFFSRAQRRLHDHMLDADKKPNIESAITDLAIGILLRGKQ